MTTGIFNTSQLTPDQAKKSFAGQITRLMPNGNAVLFGLTSMLSSDTAVQVEHGFFTKTMLFPQLTLSAAALITDTILNVTTTANVLGGMVMRVNTTGENVTVLGILGPTQVQVQRGTGSTPVAAIASAVNLYQVGTAFEESSLRPNALAINPVRVTNFTQIFRNTWAISGSTQATQMIVGDTNVAENRTDCAAFHAADIEKALFFGQKYLSAKNGQPIRYMDGILSIVSNLAYYPSNQYSAVNVTTTGSTTNYTQFEAAFDPAFNQTTDPRGANERVMFVGGVAKKVINNIGRNNGTYYMVNGQTSWGLQFSTISIARGTFRMIEHPLFNSNPDWGKMAWAIDLASFNLAYLSGRKTQNMEFNMAGDQAADNGIDAVGGTLTTELTTVIKNPPANAIMFNLTAGVAG